MLSYRCILQFLYRVGISTASRYARYLPIHSLYTIEYIPTYPYYYYTTYICTIIYIILFPNQPPSDKQREYIQSTRAQSHFLNSPGNRNATICAQMGSPGQHSPEILRPFPPPDNASFQPGPYIERYLRYLPLLFELFYFPPFLWENISIYSTLRGALLNFVSDLCPPPFPDLFCIYLIISASTAFPLPCLSDISQPVHCSRRQVPTCTISHKPHHIYLFHLTPLPKSQFPKYSLIHPFHESDVLCFLFPLISCTSTLRASLLTRQLQFRDSTLPIYRFTVSLTVSCINCQCLGIRRIVSLIVADLQFQKKKFCNR